MPEGKTKSYLDDCAALPDKSDTEYKAFSFGRVGARSQAILTFVKSDDYVEAISYANLNRIWSSDVSTQIQLDFGERTVLIEGTTLNDLFNYIRLNRCSEVIEQSKRSAMETKEGEPIVTNISIRKVGS